MSNKKSPIDIGRSNRLIIYNYFVSHPCATNKDASSDLDISVVTIGKHAKAIRGGWKPEEVKDNA